MNINLKNLSIPQQILLVSITLSIVLLLFVLSFSVNQNIQSKNSIKASLNRNRSFAVIEKIDRNFYERFGDVQAFAYNKLAAEAIARDSATGEVRDFINTMIRYYVLYDVMMILNKDGEVIAVNTVDKNNHAIASQGLIGLNFSGEPWFHTCLSPAGPEGGAWYSDFIESALVGKIYGNAGRGMAFAAPIKNSAGQTIGAWYNFANWSDVTQGIRSETEDLLKQEEPEAFILITDKQNKVIDAADETLINTAKINIGFSGENDDFQPFTFHGKTITADDYIVSEAVGKGAYTYKGNNWKVLTLVPKTHFSFSIFTSELSTFSLAIILILLGGIASFLLLSKSISRKINGLQASITSVSIGELVEIEKSNQTDEIGQMTNSVKSLVDGLRNTAMFANEIGQGKLETKFEPLSEKDVLGISLVTMRDNLLQIRRQEERRQWVTQGLAEFGDKLRKNSNAGISTLCDDIIVFICKYVHANQAAIFVTEESDGSRCLEMTSCFAWDRKKFMSKKLSPGEGLVGQVWQEGETLYMINIPDNYIKITSGLGEANPSCLMIIPLRSNGEVMGVIEIAAFKPFEDHVREFLEKIAESLASTLASAKINDRTRTLLEQTQQQAEEMRSQEEEMRQNMEEMQATQEEFNRRERSREEEFERREKEYIAEIQSLRLKLNVTNNSKQVA